MIRVVNRFVRVGVLLAGMALLVSACGMFYDYSGRKTAKPPQPAAAQPAATVTRDEPFVAVPPPDSPTIAVPSRGSHKVQRGNTVYSISRLYGVPVRAIIEANGLTPPYLLKVGDTLTIPKRQFHRVARGETVYSISRSYGVPMNELTRANGIAPPYTIVVGQELTIPATSENQVATAEAQSAAGGTVEVEELSSPTPAPTPAASPAPAATPIAPKPAVAPTPKARPAPPPPPKPVATATPAQKEALPKPPSRAGSTFRWPVRGKVISGFGTQDGGRHNDGINISAGRGTTVVAAENGVVAYAGNELRGFGNLLLIKHADGYMTAYAHNDVLLVDRGATVKKGQPIAKVGSTGSVGSPQLHFEIRKGRKAVDPLDYLPRRAASN